LLHSPGLVEQRFRRAAFRHHPHPKHNGDVIPQHTERSLDLSRFAGQTVRLVFEADAERTGTVALFGSPTLYTPGRLSVSIVDDATGAANPEFGGG
jgi:hypothetical protein